MIAGATGLRNADWSPFTQDKSDPYCICEVVGKPQCKFRTATLQNTLNPVWNHIQRIDGFSPGDTITFVVWDQDRGKKDDKLGQTTLESSDILPYGFVGKLQLLNAGNSTAAIHLLVLPMPICNGVLDVMRMGSLEPRYFSLNEEVLLYFTDSEDYETGAPERGSIVLSDIESFEVDTHCSLLFHIYRLPEPIQVHCRNWDEASVWGAAIDRALLLRGFGSEKDLLELTGVVLCEGLLHVDSGGQAGKTEAPLYVCLFQDIIIGYRDYLTFRNSKGSSLWVEPLGQVKQVTAEAVDVISITFAGKAMKLHTSGWDDTMRWGSGFLHALQETEQTPSKVAWQSFLSAVLYEGQLDIIRGSGQLPRYFVLYGTHMAYYKTKEEFLAKGKQNGAVECQHISKVILGNEATLTIKLVNGSVFQLKECEPGDGVVWADAWDKVLRMRSMPAVLRFDWHAAEFSWEFFAGAER